MKKTPRGIRNHNPGNIRWGDPWQGLRPKAKRTDTAYARSSPVGHRRQKTTPAPTLTPLRSACASLSSTTTNRICRWTCTAHHPRRKRQRPARHGQHLVRPGNHQQGSGAGRDRTRHAHGGPHSRHQRDHRSNRHGRRWRGADCGRAHQHTYRHAGPGQRTSVQRFYAQAGHRRSPDCSRRLHRLVADQASPGRNDRRRRATGAGRRIHRR